MSNAKVSSVGEDILKAAGEIAAYLRGEIAVECYEVEEDACRLMADRRKTETKHHKDGSLWATGTTRGGVLDGYWEWFRKDGTKMRSGHFTMGEQTGEWITYDKTGSVYKVTRY